MNYASVMTQSFRDEMRKIASAKMAGGEQAAKGLLSKLVNKYTVTAAGSVGAYEALRRAERDRRLGKRLRMQSGRY